MCERSSVSLVAVLDTIIYVCQADCVCLVVSCVKSDVGHIRASVGLGEGYV